MKKRKINQCVWICGMVLCVMLSGCGSQKTSESQNGTSKPIQNNENISNNTLNSEISTLVEPTIVTEKNEDKQPGEISCKLENGALIFSGTGYLFRSDVEQLVMETVVDEVTANSIVKVVIEEGITGIGMEAFSGMPVVKEIEIAGSVNRIGEYAFEECENIEKIILAEGISEIGVGAFEECTNLSDVEIPKSVEIISSGAFAETPWLETKKLEDKVVIVNDILFDATEAGTDFELPENVFYIPRTAFLNADWVEKQRETEQFIIINGVLIDGQNASGDVVIPEGVKHIADAAFFSCDKITSVSIPDGVESIGTSAFQQCSNLLTINIPDSVRRIGASAFGRCSCLTEIKLPNGLRAVESYAFYECTGLKNVEMPETIEYIGEYCFQFCSSLPDIKLPKNVQKIGDEAFYSCESIRTIVLPDAMTKIADGAFTYCRNLESVVLPKNVKEIGRNAFLYCEKLNNIEFFDKLESIGEGAFCYTALNKVIFPESVQNIGRIAFADCKNLEEIEFSENVTSIGDGAFYGTSWMENKKQGKDLVIVNAILLVAPLTEEKVIIPKGVNVICGGAFENNTMTAIEFPDTVTVIGESAFGNCNNLTEISIPNSVVEIRESTFEDCKNLIEISLPDTITVIGKNAFRNCSSLTEINIPDSVIEINEGAFSNCSNLTKIDIPNSVTDINSRAFAGCCSLENIKLPKKITSIAWELFDGCSNLKCVVIPDGVRHISSYAFDDCSNLVSVAIPHTVKEIYDAFDKCYNLTIYCDKGSFAEQYAIENEIRYMIVNEDFWANGANLPTERPSLREIIESNVDGLIMIDGEKCHAVMGEDKALVWKYVEATFDERAYFASAMVQDMSQVYSSYQPDYLSDAFRYTNWFKWYGWDEFSVKHVGDDMFLFEGYIYGEYFGYYINGSWHTTIEVNSWLEDEDDRFNRVTAFNDGYAIGIYENKYRNGFDYWLALLDKQGNMTVSEIDVGKNYYWFTDRPGIYSDGLFYHDNAFYDINFKKFLDLSGKGWGNIYVKQDIYAPFFQDGICRLITEKNGKYWIFDIDKSGEIISDVEEFDILSLSY